MREQIPPISGNPDFSVRRNRHPRQFWADQITDQRRRRNSSSGEQKPANRPTTKIGNVLSTKHGAAPFPSDLPQNFANMAMFVDWLINNPDVAATESVRMHHAVNMYRLVDSSPHGVNELAGRINSEPAHNQLV